MGDELSNSWPALIRVLAPACLGMAAAFFDFIADVHAGGQPAWLRSRSYLKPMRSAAALAIAAMSVFLITLLRTTLANPADAYRHGAFFIQALSLIGFFFGAGIWYRTAARVSRGLSLLGKGRRPAFNASEILSQLATGARPVQRYWWFYVVMALLGVGEHLFFVESSL